MRSGTFPARGSSRCRNCLRAPELDAVRSIVTICRSGARSAQAAVLLQKSGYAKVVNLACGTLRWRSRVLAVEDGAD
jgi:rhodanese-related sulfurtransferase